MSAAPPPTVVCDSCGRPAPVFLIWDCAAARHYCTACYRVDHPTGPGSLRTLLEDLRTYLRDELAIASYEPEAKKRPQALLARVEERLELPPEPRAAAAPPQEKPS